MSGDQWNDVYSRQGRESKAGFLPCLMSRGARNNKRVDRRIPIVYDKINRYTFVYQNMPINMYKKKMMYKPACTIFQKTAGVQKMQEKGRKAEWSVYQMGNGKL